MKLRPKLLWPPWAPHPPSDYRWRTAADALFTLSSAEKYEYEWETNNDAYVEIAPPEIPASGVTLSESSLVLDVDETAQLTAAIVPEDTTDKLVWASSDPSVATVSQDGLVTAVGPGSAVITAAAGEASAACSVHRALRPQRRRRGTPPGPMR